MNQIVLIISLQFLLKRGGIYLAATDQSALEVDVDKKNGHGHLCKCVH